MTQQDLASALGVTQPTVNRWESGVVDPPRRRIVIAARLLGVMPAWLEFGEEERTSVMTDEQAARRAGREGRIAFQGVPGAYSHLACAGVFPKMEAVAFPTFDAAFRAVEDGDTDLAMIPIENSLGGRVADIHHLLPNSSLYIIDEHFQPVQHQLLGLKGATLDGIREVWSHEQALAQCRDLITELGVKPVQRADTAGAAREVAEKGDKTIAAIASSLAGETYGLDALRNRIEDRIGNTTRFVILSRRREEPDLRDGPCMTSLIFQVRSVPASLYKCLGGFATNGVNITKLESYITDASFTVAQFYAEIEGHPAEKNVDLAFDELQYFSTKMKVIGTYPKHPFRIKG
jgi:prephenate dehydratase